MKRLLRISLDSAVFSFIPVLSWFALGLIVDKNLSNVFTTDKNIGTTFLHVLNTAGILAIILFATWGATKVFDDAFYEVYQIITFGQCLCPQNKKKEDD